MDIKGSFIRARYHKYKVKCCVTLDPDAAISPFRSGTLPTPVHVDRPTTLLVFPLNAGYPRPSSMAAVPVNCIASATVSGCRTAFAVPSFSLIWYKARFVSNAGVADKVMHSTSKEKAALIHAIAHPSLKVVKLSS